MYYDQQPIEHKENYKKMLTIVGSLSRLFSDSKSPYLYYRAHENIFAKYFNVENNSRSDDSADACDIMEGIGIGLKTWVGQDDQKVAEFGRLRPQYEHLRGIELIKTIAEYRNTRIRITMNSHGLNLMIYHIIKRVPNAMYIYESSFDSIDIENIRLIENRGNSNNIYFEDGRHTYHFSLSKNTLFMIFDNLEPLDFFEVEIHEDPYAILSNLVAEAEPPFLSETIPTEPQLCLRLYSTDKNGMKFVPEKSGLNQWNAGGRRRDFNEIYIPYPATDRRRVAFFPPKDSPFDLMLPDGRWISAKICQQDGKAIMSNPNKDLGEWLLRNVFEIPEGTILTYDMLRQYNVDSVIFTKIDDYKYSINFGELGTYERFYQLEDLEA